MTEEYGHIPDGFFLSDKEVEELRKSKKELTEYGKQQLRKLMGNYIPDDDAIEEVLNVKLTDEKKQELEEMRNQEPLHAKVSDEDYQKVLDA